MARSRFGRAAQPKRRRGEVTWPILLGLGVSMVAAAWHSPQLLWRFDEPQVVTETVSRGPLQVSVVERGEVDSARKTTLRHTAQQGGGLAILKLAEEGSWVEEGDTVVVLDSWLAQRHAQKYQIWVYFYEAYQKTAEAQLAIQKMANESMVAAAQHQLQIAELDLKRFVEGEYVQKKHKFEGEIAMAAEGVFSAEQQLRFEEQSLRKGFSRVDDVKANRFAVEKARIYLDRAREKLHILDEFTRKREIAQLEDRVARFAKEVERVKLREDIAVGQRELDVLYGKRWAAYYRYYYNQAMKRIEACTIRAPHAGVVVYANSDNHGGSGPQIFEGARVFEGQAIVHLPDASRMQVEARIHESKILAVREGLEATIQVDARSGASYRGVVEKVSQVPLSANWPNLNLKEYSTVIRVIGEPEEIAELKPGMTAQVTIHADPVEDVLQVPVRVCVQRGGRHFVWVVDGKGRPARREVMPGASNDYAVEVVSGLSEGEKVVAHPRTDLADEVVRLQEEIAESSEPPPHQETLDADAFWEDFGDVPSADPARTAADDPDRRVAPPPPGGLSQQPTAPAR